MTSLLLLPPLTSANSSPAREPQQQQEPQPQPQQQPPPQHKEMELRETTADAAADAGDEGDEETSSVLSLSKYLMPRNTRMEMVEVEPKELDPRDVERLAVDELFEELWKDEAKRARYNRARDAALTKCLGEIAWKGGSAALHLSKACDLHNCPLVGVIIDSDASPPPYFCPRCVDLVLESPDIHRRGVRPRNPHSITLSSLRRANHHLPVYRGDNNTFHLWSVCPGDARATRHRRLEAWRRFKTKRRSRHKITSSSSSSSSPVGKVKARTVCAQCYNALLHAFLEGIAPEFDALFPLRNGRPLT